MPAEIVSDEVLCYHTALTMETQENHVGLALSHYWIQLFRKFCSVYT